MSLTDFTDAVLEGLKKAAPTAAFWGGGGQFEGKLGPYSTIRLGGKIFPGVSGFEDEGACPVKLGKGGVSYRIDSQKVKGKSGHKLSTEAYEPSKFTLDVKIHSPAQWAAYKKYFAEINPKSKENNRKAFAIEHPVLTLYGINSIYINGATFPDGDMIRDVTLSCIEVFAVSGSGKSKTVKATDAKIKVEQPFQNVTDQAAVEPRKP